MADGADPERISRTARPRWPAGIVGMLATILVVEVVLTQIGAESWTIAIWMADRKSATRDCVKAAEILCLGDSLVKIGVVPQVLEARLDRTVYNLGTVGNPTPATYSLFRRALAAGARPRAIVLDAHEPQLWSSEYRNTIAAWANLVGVGEALRLSLDRGDPGLMGPYLAYWLLPSVRLRSELRDSIAGLISWRKSEATVGWIPVYERQHRRNRGAILFPQVQSNYSPQPWLFDAPYYGNGKGLLLGTRMTNVVYLDRILSLARSHRITVFFVVPPIHPGVLAARERLGHEAHYLGVIRRVCGRHDNVIVVDGRHSGFGAEQFIDDCHMHVGGATALSQGLAEVMADRLDGPPGGDRWVALPRFAEPEVRVAVETVDESQRSVAWERMRR